MSKSTPSPTLETRHLKVSMEKKEILHDFSLTAYPGRIHALLGRNGAGKSTAFKSILGLVPVEGEVFLFGEHFSVKSLREVGASINGPALYLHLSARDNLRVHCLALGITSAEADRVLKLVGLGDVGKKKVGKFSTGMKARVALAVALLGSPRLLILDEPQNGLDPQGMNDLRSFLRHYADTGNTVIISSHQLGEIARIADDVTVIHDGRTVFSGPASEFKHGGDLESEFLKLTAGM